MERKLTNWLDYYITYTKETEYPKLYHIWAGISCIAGALQRRMFLPWGPYKIYPNMFIILVGKSGLGKGQSMNPGIEIFKNLTLPVCADAITSEQLFNELEKAVDTFETKGGRETHMSLQIFSRELAVFLGQRDIKFLAHLTDLYDCHDEWEYKTKNKGENKFTGVCLNLLGACAPDWISTIFPPEALGGGFTSRVIFIVQSEKAQILPFPIYTENHVKLRTALSYDLMIIARMTGEFSLSECAKEYYTEFYYKQEELLKQDKFHIRSPLFAGYSSRRSFHLRKLGMIMNVSRKDGNQIITAEDLDKGYKCLSEAEKTMEQAFVGLGKEQLIANIATITSYLLREGKATRSQVLQDLDTEITSEVLVRVTSHLEQKKFITINRDHELGEETYEIIGKNT